MDTGSFYYMAFVFLTAAVIAVPIARRLGLGSVLGYLISGILIGPAVMGLLGDERHGIMHFSEFGVVMMLFVIGLELEPALLWRMRIPLLGLGGLQVIITGLAISGVSLALGYSWQVAVSIGMIFSLSSTAITLQTLQEKGLMKSQAGQNAFSVLLFQDIAVIPMLAIFPLLAAEGASVEDHGHGLISHYPRWLQLAITFGAIGVIILGGRYLVRPVFRSVAKARLRELFTGFALLLIISIQVLMTAVGLSPALGAFLAGVVLANSEFKHELEGDIEPFKGLLLGVFFMTVGASIDFNLILTNPVLFVGVITGLILLKSIILLVLGMAFRMPLDQNFTFSSSLAQVGEFAFVLLTYAAKGRIIDEQTGGILTAVTAVSMGLTPLMILTNERLVLPRLKLRADDNNNQRPADEINERNPVIIAGFGRFGNIVGRMLRANGLKATVLDNDADRVDMLRKLGLKVYYGDAARHDLLHAAGAEEARLIVIAMDSEEKTKELVSIVKKHYPHLHMLVRATDRTDAYELIEMGADKVYRETLDTSLRMATDALQFLGVRAYQTHRAAQTFLKHDEKALLELARVRKDEKAYISEARERIADLEELIKSDARDIPLERDMGWDPDSLRKEATGK